MLLSYYRVYRGVSKRLSHGLRAWPYSNGKATMLVVMCFLSGCGGVTSVTLRSIVFLHFVSMDAVGF